MGFELYAERPLSESLAVETIAGAVTATVACCGARALMDKETRELSPARTMIAATAALLASWAATTVARRVCMKLNP